MDPAVAEELAERANEVEVTLIGPGMLDKAAASALLARLLPQLKPSTLILDALALSGGQPMLSRLPGGNLIITPNLKEMAELLGGEVAGLKADLPGTAKRAAADLNAVVALKGADTYLAAPNGNLYLYRGQNLGLATSGSGDILAGLIAGLAARGASPLQAAVWSVYLHGEAGQRLVQHWGPLGFLARELPAEIPPLLAAFDAQ